MKLIIVRHGETEENKAHILQGHLPGKLSQLGIEQAKKVALRLKEEPVEVIYSSDLARAVDTAKEIHKFHPGVDLIFTEKLREKNMGSYTSLNYKEVDWDNPPRDMETRESMRIRVKSLIDEVYSKYQNKTVVFVGHGGINKAIIALVKGEGVDYDLVNSGNTAVTIFEIYEDNKHKIHCLNCTKHL